MPKRKWENKMRKWENIMFLPVCFFLNLSLYSWSHGQMHEIKWNIWKIVNVMSRRENKCNESEIEQLHRTDRSLIGGGYATSLERESKVSSIGQLNIKS